MDTPSLAAERRVVGLIGAVSFVNILDFMVVMPLGPDFAAELGIPTAKLGLVGGAYTAAAAIAGLVGAVALDRFDRRKALGVALVGLMAGTVAGGLATGLGSMLAARVLAGAFGGPATSLGYAILTDVVPVERRGKALGAVMSSFSVASILGVPVALELARWGGWRTPFFAIAALGLVLAGGAIWLLPPVRGHLDRPADAPARRPVGAFLRDPAVLLALLGMAAATVSGFAVIPNLSSYIQYNLGYPRESLGLLYGVGGFISFFTLRAAGRLVDRHGPLISVATGTVLFAGNLALGFAWPVAGLPVMALFCMFMFANGFRMVGLNTLATRVPLPPERARFMSAQSAVQHLAASAGAMLAAAILAERDDHALIGMDRVAALALAVSILVPVLVAAIQASLRRRDAVAESRPAPSVDRE